MRIATLLTTSLALSACAAGGLSEERHPTGSASLAPASDYSRVYAVNSDAGTVSIIDPVRGLLGSVDVGLEPVRIARAGDKVYVTTRGTGEVVELTESGDSLVQTGRIAVGPDPFGLVASEDGTRLFVAVGMNGQVLEIDTASNDILRSFAVPDQPRWVGLHPSGERLYVGSAFGGTWSDIDLVGGQVVTHTPPGRAQAIFDELDVQVALTPRITGDLSVSPFGDFVAIPVFYVDNTTPVDGEDGGPGTTGGYASGPGVGRTNPSVLIVGTGKDGEPAPEGSRTLFAQAIRISGGGVDNAFDETDFVNVRSYVSSVTVSPDGLSVLATMEGSETIVTVPLEAEEGGRNGLGRGGMDAEFDMMLTGGFEFPQSVAIATETGPRGVVFLKRDQAVVDSWLSRTVSSVPYGQARSMLRDQILKGERFFVDPSQALSVEQSFESAPSVLAPEVEQGRKLFYSATSSAMAAHSGGISCATCHYDGRNDGLTWTFAEGERQTPSLAGVVSETTPVTWTAQVPTVATEVRLTSRDRMGGTGATVSQSYDVEDYIDTTPYPQGPSDLDADAVARGRDLFFGEAECATCHNGAAYTDRVAYDMFGLSQVMTPALRGIAATAPYLHDGSAPTLRDLVEVAEAGGMGRTNQLTEQQKDDLALFVATL